MNVLLAGPYPVGTLVRLREALEGTGIHVSEAPTQADFDAQTDADAVILRVLKMPAETIIHFSPRLKLILRWGAGFDSVDVKAAGARGVQVCNTPGANAYAVSEMTVLLMLAVGRKLLCHDRSLHRGEWSKNIYLNQTYSLNNKLVGVVGAGNIGRQVAQKVRVFGAQVQYYDSFRIKPEMEEQYGMRFVEMDALLRTSDIVTLHVPLLDSTRHMISAEKINEMKDGAILINAARGGLMEDDAVLAAVKRGKLAGAGIDCVEREPLSATDPLLSNPNVIVTPHVAGGTADIADEVLPMLVSNLHRLAAGDPLEYVVNREFLA